jgi:hypothetical protein
MTTPSNIANATILETESSKIRRMHDVKPPSRSEQIQLRAIAQASWAKDGYIISSGVVEEEGDERISVTPDSAVGMSPLPLATEGHAVDDLNALESIKTSL